ncbi:MAG: sugar phosphate nucleotidyltransferase [Lentisphaeria bacterium]|nr:sugar phosphate nucleotidyltransferase [Lentisphaeria bacterium]
MSDLTLLILAAGMGSRYGGLKQIDPVGPSGEIVLDYSIYDAIQAGFTNVVFLIRKDIEDEFKQCIGKRYEGKIKTAYAFQELANLPSGYTVPDARSKPWGTGHAVLCSQEAIKGPFCVINADDFYGADAFKTVANHLKTAEESSYCMAAYLLENTLSEHGTVSRGVCAVENGKLQSVTEITNIEIQEGAIISNSDLSLSGSDYVSLNFWGFTEGLFKHLEMQFKKFLDERIAEEKSEFFLPTVVDEMLKQDDCAVAVLETTDNWFGVTYPEDKPIVISKINDLIKAGKYPETLWQ